MLNLLLARLENDPLPRRRSSGPSAGVVVLTMGNWVVLIRRVATSFSAARKAPPFQTYGEKSSLDPLSGNIRLTSELRLQWHALCFCGLPMPLLSRLTNPSADKVALTI